MYTKPNLPRLPDLLIFGPLPLAAFPFATCRPPGSIVSARACVPGREPCFYSSSVMFSWHTSGITWRMTHRNLTPFAVGHKQIPDELQPAFGAL